MLDCLLLGVIWFDCLFCSTICSCWMYALNEGRTVVRWLPAAIHTRVCERSWCGCSFAQSRFHWPGCWVFCPRALAIETARWHWDVAKLKSALCHLWRAHSTVAAKVSAFHIFLAARVLCARVHLLCYERENWCCHNGWRNKCNGPSLIVYLSGWQEIVSKGLLCHQRGQTKHLTGHPIPGGVLCCCTISISAYKLGGCACFVVLNVQLDGFSQAPPWKSASVMGNIWNRP